MRIQLWILGEYLIHVSYCASHGLGGEKKLSLEKKMTESLCSQWAAVAGRVNCLCGGHSQSSPQRGQRETGLLWDPQRWALLKEAAWALRDGRTPAPEDGEQGGEELGRVNYRVKVKCTHLTENLENTNPLKKSYWLDLPKTTTALILTHLSISSQCTFCNGGASTLLNCGCPSWVWLSWQEQMKTPPAPHYPEGIWEGPHCLLQGDAIVTLRNNILLPQTHSSGYTSGWSPFLEGTIQCCEEKVKSVECTYQNTLRLSTLVEMSVNIVRWFFSPELRHSRAGMVLRDSWADSRLSRSRKEFPFAH